MCLYMPVILNCLRNNRHRWAWDDFHFNPDRLEFVEITGDQPIKYSIVPSERVYYLLAGAILMIIISVFIFCKAHHLSLCKKNDAVFFTRYCSDTFKEIKGSKVKYLLLIPLGACIYYAYTVPHNT